MKTLSIDKYGDKRFNFRVKGYNYTVELDAVIGQTVVHLSEHVQKMTTVHMFDNFVYPVLKVSLLLNKNLYNQLSEDVQNLYWRFSLYKVEADPSGENKVTGLPQSCYKNIKMKAIDFEKNRFGEFRTDMEGQSHNNEQVLELELMAEDHLKINRGRIFGVYRDMDMQDMLAYVFANAVPKGELLLHEPDNVRNYPELIMKGLNAPATIYHFNKTYGIYRSGLRLFFDFEDYYCLPNDLINSMVKKELGDFENVYVNVVDSISNRTIDYTGSYIDFENQRYYVTARNVSAVAADDSNRETFGESIDVFEYEDGANRYTTESGRYTHGSTNQTINKTNLNSSLRQHRYYKKYDNDFALSSNIFEQIKDNLKLILTMDNVEDDFLKMNKRYFIEFRNSELNTRYRGTYQITGKIATYTKNGHVFEYKNHCIFNRLTKSILAHS